MPFQPLPDDPALRAASISVAERFLTRSRVATAAAALLAVLVSMAVGIAGTDGRLSRSAVLFLAGWLLTMSALMIVTYRALHRMTHQ
jgi:hypothetical protein